MNDFPAAPPLARPRSTTTAAHPADADSPPTEARPPLFRESGASRAIEVVGDAWVLRLLRSAFRGTRRFSDFLAELPVSRAVLSDRLARMVADGLMERIAPEGGHSEYRLTERGLDLWSVLLAMWQWERDHGTGTDDGAPPADRPRRALRHTACGHPCEPVYACQSCRQAVTAFDTGIAEPRGTGRRGTQTLPQALPPRKRYRKSLSDDRSSLPTLMRVFGDRWNTALTAAALQGARTFSDFERLVAIGPAQLADRLNEMQALGLMRARQYAGSRQEYRLTRKAIATYPITLELMRWGDRWLWQGRSPLAVSHRPCGALLKSGWRCGTCHGTLARRTIRFEDAP